MPWWLPALAAAGLAALICLVALVSRAEDEEIERKEDKVGVKVNVKFDTPGHKRGTFEAGGRRWVIDWVAECFDHGLSEVQVYEADEHGSPRNYIDIMTLVGVDADLERDAQVFVDEYMEEDPR